MQLSLVISYCHPILHVTHASSVIMLKVRQLNDLNGCWNSVYCKIFGFYRWESVNVFTCGLGRLTFKHIFCVMQVPLGMKSSLL